MTEFDSVIPAGESGTLTAKIKTTSTQSGPISKSVAVTTDAPGAERLTLSVTFTAVTAVSVLPRPQLTLNGVQGDSPSATVVLRREDGKELEITGIDNSDDRLVIEAVKVSESAVVSGQRVRPGDVLLNVSTAPETEPVAFNGRFRVATNHPDAATIDLVYAIRLRPLIEARPAQLRLLLQEGNSTGRTTLFRIQHNRQGQFKLTGAKASKPELFRAQLVDGDVEAQVHTVAVMLQDDVEAGDLESRVLESLVISTDDPEQAEIELSVLIEPRELRRPGQARPLE